MWEHKTGIQGRALIEIKDFSHGMQRSVEKARSLIPQGWETVANRLRTVTKSEQEQGSLAQAARERGICRAARVFELNVLDLTAHVVVRTLRLCP